MVLLLCRNTPVPMVNPRALLTFFTAVLCPPAPSAFGKLPGVFLPFAALIIRALPNATTSVVFAAQVPHDNSSPVLHVLGMMSHREFFDQGEDVEVVWLEILIFQLLLWQWFAAWQIAVKH